MSRAKHPKRVYGEDVLSVSPEQKRFSTPEIVGLYRAEKLACKTIVDLCCGYGFQSFAFSQFCNHVISVDIDPKKIFIAKKYAEILGLRNITFVCGNVIHTEIISKIALYKPDVIFCDPQRLASEEKRNLATVQPDIDKLLMLYSSITKQIAIELPPQLNFLYFKEFCRDAECEYLAVNGVLNRLTLYFGALRCASKSVVLLPNCQRIEATGSQATINQRYSTAGYHYILEPNPAIVLANLYEEALCYDNNLIHEAIAQKNIVQILQGNKIFFLCKEKISNPFFTTYEILQRMVYVLGNQEQHKKLISLLIQEGAKDIVLRYSLDPKQYWEERNNLEKALVNGHKTIHLFIFDMAILTTKII